MDKNLNILNENLASLINQKISHAKLGVGSFFTLDFGKLTEESFPTKNGICTAVHGEWEIWIKMACWEFEQDQEVVLHNESSREKIEIFLEKLKGKALIDFEITSDRFDAFFAFEDNLILYVIANIEQEHYDQWTLFLSDGQCMTAGPGTSITIEDG